MILLYNYLYSYSITIPVFIKGNFIFDTISNIINQSNQESAVPV